MGRSGGGGGGGHGGGGFSGGGRSSGGFSGGGHGGRSSFGGHGGGFHGGGHSSSGGGFVQGMILGSLLSSRGSGSGSGGGMRPPSGGPQPSRGPGGSGGGCKSVVLWAVLALLLVVVLFNVMSSGGCSSSDITASTVQREALPSSAVTETAYYTDEDGDWIRSASTLESGLRSFYQDTGVQPYVYILPNNETTSSSELSNLASQLYDQLFTDEGHFLLVFCYNSSTDNYYCGYSVGSQAKTVMDFEAIEVLRDYLDRYWYDFSSEEEFFSDAFEDTGERIMTVTPTLASALPYVAVAVAVIALGVVAVVLVKKRNQREKERAAETERILSTPLQTYGDKEVEDLAQKHENAPMPETVATGAASTTSAVQQSGAGAEAASASEAQGTGTSA